MMNKKFTKLMKGCALAMALAMTTVSISAYAAEPTPTPTLPSAEVNTVQPDAADKNTDPTSTGKFDPTMEGYTDTKIDVWGYTKDTVVYSVDVEWGAMTFEYEAYTWNPETHKKDTTNAGWKIYDEGTDKALAVDQDAINRVTVTNHSNAPVYAKMSYTGVDDYTGITGEFSEMDGNAETDASATNVKASWDGTTNYLTLQTAATDADDQAVADNVEGTPAKGNVYFKPTTGVDAGKEIAKWTKIGTINVAVQTNDPAATPVAP